MQDPLSQSAPNVYEDPASINAWDDAPVSQSMHTHSSTLSTDKPLPAPSEERDRQRSRNSSLLSVSSGVNGGKIYGQPDTPLPQPSVINVSGSSALPAFLKIRVTGISKNRRDYLVEFDASTNIPEYEGTAYRNVQRTYEELAKLSEQLALANPATIVPALPPNATNAQTEEEDDRRVKLALQRWFDRISDDGELRKDMDMRAFVMNKFSYVPVQVFRRKASSFSWLGRPTPDDDLELVTAKDLHATQETAFLACVATLENLIRKQRDKASAESVVGEKLINLAIAEKSRSLSRSLETFGRCQQMVSEVGLGKCANDLVTLYDGFNYHASNSKAVKDTLEQRTQLLEEYQLAVKAGIGKRRTLEKMKGGSAINGAKVDELLGDLHTAQGYEKHLANKVENMSRNLHSALEKHAHSVEKDLYQILIENARMGVVCARQSINELEVVQNVIDGIGEVNTAGVGVAKSISRQEEEQVERQRHEARVESKRREERDRERMEREMRMESEQSVGVAATEQKANPRSREAGKAAPNSPPKEENTSRDPLGASILVTQDTGDDTDAQVQTQTQSTIIPRVAVDDRDRKSMSQSTTSLSDVDRERRMKLERKRMNAREAASKLANAF